MIRYVVGFMFTEDLKNVVLIKKNRPEWQKGKLNGVGGHARDGETFEAAMVREFLEETGVKTNIPQWSFKLLIKNFKVGYELAVLFAVSNSAWNVDKITDEEPFCCSMEILNPIYRGEIIPNLSWIIPFCLDEQIKPLVVVEDIGVN